jgi:hypothetical protein
MKLAAMPILARRLAIACLAAVLALPGAAIAQIPGASVIPDLATMGGSNAAGVLSYRARHKLIDTAESNKIYSALTKKPGVSQDSSYTSGSAGTILTGSGTSFSLDKAPKKVRQKGCNLVLSQTRSML